MDPLQKPIRTLRHSSTCLDTWRFVSLSQVAFRVWAVTRHDITVESVHKTCLAHEDFALKETLTRRHLFFCRERRAQESEQAPCTLTPTHSPNGEDIHRPTTPTPPHTQHPVEKSLTSQPNQEWANREQMPQLPFSDRPAAGAKIQVASMGFPSLALAPAWSAAG